MGVTSPRNLDQLRAMPPGLDRIKAADAYISEREEAIRQARSIRDGDVRTLVAAQGVAKVRDLTGYSASTIRVIRGRPGGGSGS